MKLVTGFSTVAVREAVGGIIVEGEKGDGHRSIGPVDRIIATTGQRPDLSLTRELRLELDPWLESAKALGPLIDPNLHSCGSVPPHGHRELSHPEPGFYTIGIKSYGRAPTFLLLTGYEQARSVAAALAGDMIAADDVHLVLPETGVCATRSKEPQSGSAGCCGAPAPVEINACCVGDADAKVRVGLAADAAWPRAAAHLPEAVATTSPTLAPSWLVVNALGLAQIFAWGSSYYLPAVLAKPISRDMNWPFAWVVGGLSLGLLAGSLASPHVGAAIERHGGRLVLAFSAVAIGTGQAGLAIAPNLSVYAFAWLVMGVGMAAGLYDANFAVLGRLYGLNARSAITTVTLYGGFASTVCWPLSAFLVSEIGWRGAGLTYATIQIAVALPLYLIVLPAAVPLARSSSRGRRG